ncbi:hypothetical protein ABVT39_010835 [Epinephelus coioides]
MTHNHAVIHPPLQNLRNRRQLLISVHHETVTCQYRGYNMTNVPSWKSSITTLYSILVGYLWQLPDGEPKCTIHRNIVKTLRTQLHSVPQGPYRLFVRSLPKILRKRLRRIRRETYAIRKAESRKLSREHLEIMDQEMYDLRAQVQELTEAKNALQQEVVMLRDQVASYRRLRMGGTSSYVPDGQQPYDNID